MDWFDEVMAGIRVGPMPPDEAFRMITTVRQHEAWMVAYSAWLDQQRHRTIGWGRERSTDD